MTFADWYASNVAPKVEAQVKNLPAQHREPLRAASRAAMAECWNAALDAAFAYDCGDTMDPVDYTPLKVKL